MRTLIKLQTIILLMIIGTPWSNLYGQDFYETIYFQKNSYTIDNKSKDDLDKLISRLKSKDLNLLKIFSYTDTLGTEESNDILAKQRGLSIYNYLKSKIKLDTTRTYLEWLGESVDTYDLHFPQAHVGQNCADILVFLYVDNKKKKSR